MSATIGGQSDSFVAAGTSGIGANLRVALTATRKIDVAGASAVEIGVTVTASKDNVTPVEVKLDNGGGSLLVTAADAFAAGTVVKRAANGKVSTGGGGADFGIAFGSSTGDGDVVVVYPL
jgi:hypothetical protein